MESVGNRKSCVLSNLNCMGHTTQLCGLRYGQYLTHAHSHITRAVAAIDSCFRFSLVPGYAMLMRPNKGETAVHGCHFLGDMAVLVRKVLTIPRSCLVCPTQFKLCSRYWRASHHGQENACFHVYGLP